MSFLGLIFKNIWRHKARTILTVIGISIGIATIVVFGLITTGFEEMFGGMISSGQTDFVVVKAGAADVVLSFIKGKQVDNLRKVDGVEEVVPLVMSVTQVGKNPYFIIIGIDSDDLGLGGISIFEGKPYTNNKEVIIGKITAENQDLRIGDKIKLNEKKYLVKGIFQSGMSWQDSGAMTTIQESQKIQGITDKVNMVRIKVAQGDDKQEVADQIEESDKDLMSIVDMADFEAADQGMEMTNKMSWTIGLLAIVIGAIGVMNTIIMSVFERTREIGVLRAVGWQRWRVVTMILGESFLIGILAAIVGSAIGIGVIYLLLNTELGRSWLVVDYQPIIFIRALAVSLGVMLFGSIYPSYKAARLLPTEALRYE